MLNPLANKIKLKKIQLESAWPNFFRHKWMYNVHGLNNLNKIKCYMEAQLFTLYNLMRNLSITLRKRNYFQFKNQFPSGNPLYNRNHWLSRNTETLQTLTSSKLLGRFSIFFDKKSLHSHTHTHTCTFVWPLPRVNEISFWKKR